VPEGRGTSIDPTSVPAGVTSYTESPRVTRMSPGVRREPRPLQNVQDQGTATPKRHAGAMRLFPPSRSQQAEDADAEEGEGGAFGDRHEEKGMFACRLC